MKLMKINMQTAEYNNTEVNRISPDQAMCSAQEIQNQTITVKKKFYEKIKRVLDICISAGAIILLMPIFAVIAILIYIDDPGGIFYGHIRIGKNGKPFKMWKFRSMYKNADKMLNQLSPEQKRQYYTEFKIDNDPRITKIGAFLRKTSLDELPQLYNVLCNEMSLVGPRPLIESEIQTYYGDTYDVLLSMKPGITGYWQAYARNNASYKRKCTIYSMRH